MSEPSTPGIVSLLLLVIYVMLKDVVIPLVRRRNGKVKNEHAHNPGTCPLFEDCSQIKSEIAKFDAQWEEQRRTNARLEGNITRIFERLDAQKN